MVFLIFSLIQKEVARCKMRFKNEEDMKSGKRTLSHSTGVVTKETSMSNSTEIKVVVICPCPCPESGEYVSQWSKAKECRKQSPEGHPHSRYSAKRSTTLDIEGRFLGSLRHIS